MYRKILLSFVLILAGGTVAAAPAATPPEGWEVMCTAVVPVPLIALEPQQIGDMVAACHALGGRVKGVRPITSD